VPSVIRGGRPESGDYEVLYAHHDRPASLRIPGVWQTWSLRRVSSSGAICLRRPAGLAVVERICKCGLHHSLDLRMAANFVVNVIFYGYGKGAAKMAGGYAGQ
jgi:hypothetical protein